MKIKGLSRKVIITFQTALGTVNIINRLNVFHIFLQLKQPANYPLRAPRPPRFDSVARFNVDKRSSLSFKKRAIFCSKFSFG